ncbi:MAG TPA: hypothetical protein VFQ61_30520 [Polyangiaceae bacterium]|nr:hypothetical protein [Polyangiaceae bacterium]
MRQPLHSGRNERPEGVAPPGASIIATVRRSRPNCAFSKCAQLGAVLALSANLLGCGQDSGTGGQRIGFELQVRSDLAPGEVYVTPRGWELRLTRAALALGPIYIWRDPPPVAANPPVRRRAWQSLSDLLIPNAHAHAGDSHFAGGEVKGEYVAQFLFDAAGEQPLPAFGPLRGSAGMAQSFSVVLDPPRAGTDDGRLQGHHAYVVGEARRGALTIPFRGGMDIGREGTQRLIDGIQTELALSQGVQVELTVRVSRWFDEADFDLLETRGDDGVFEITDGSQAHTAWFIGLRSFDAFSMRLAP